MAAININVPDIGDSTDVEVIEIHVKPGDQIAVDDPMITLESDKAAMDVPASSAGTVKKIMIKVGDKVSEGSKILELESADATSAAQPSAEDESSSDTGSLSKGEPESKVEPASKEESADGSDAVQTSTAPVPAAAPPASDAAAANTVDFQRVHASPVVRALAREMKVDLNQITGTGTNARITRKDVEAFAKTGGQSASLPAGSQAGGVAVSPIPAVDFSKFGSTELSPLSKIKRLTAENLHRSWLNIPHVTHHDEADITDTEAFRKTLKSQADTTGVRVTLLGFFMKAVAVALKEFPTFNSALAPDGQNLILKKYYNIGIAVDTPNGLVVPVIRDVDQKSLLTLSAELGELSVKARERKLKTNDLQGGCFTISSLGGIGGTYFTPIVNAPEVAILGLTRSKLQPVPKGESFEFRLMQPMSLSYDHRVIDGAEAARFVKRLGELVNDLRLLLL